MGVVFIGKETIKKILQNTWNKLSFYPFNGKNLVTGVFYCACLMGGNMTAIASNNTFICIKHLIHIRKCRCFNRIVLLKIGENKDLEASVLIESKSMLSVKCLSDNCVCSHSSQSNIAVLLGRSILHADDVATLASVNSLDPEWIDAHKYTNPTNLYEGEIGEIAGVRFVQTTEAKIYENGVFGSLFFGENAYGVTEITGGGLQTIVKQKGSAGTGDPLDQRSSVGWKAIKTAEILVQPYLVRVESCSPRFSATAVAN